jgi:undecaprenyl-diphosphatase
MPLLRNKYIWYPLYVFIISYYLLSFGALRGAIYITSLITCVILVDITSSQIVKKTIQRTRPCNEINLDSVVKERATCRFSYSFPSSHAANHFAIATFLILLGNWKRYVKFSLYIWAAMISYAQIYVGLHYPIDVFGGAILGILIARVYYYSMLKMNLY